MTSIARTPSRRRPRRAVSTTALLAALGLAVSWAVAVGPVGHAAEQARPGSGAGPSSPTGGFLLQRGRFTPIVTPPGLADEAPQGIDPLDVNDRGQLVGAYGPIGCARGVLLERERFTKLDVPGAKGTQPQGVNNRGQVVGKYSDASCAVSAPGAPVRGFLYERGRYVRLDFPGAVSSQAFDINDHGQVVGEYVDTDGEYHGYLWERGRFRTIGRGGATGINNRGQIVGVTGDPGVSVSGYLLDRGRITTFTAPGAQLTVPYGINDQGRIVGLRTDSPTVTTGSGFLRDPSGRFTAINQPGADTTVTFDINNRGQIAGVGLRTEDLTGPLASPPPPQGQ
jgi:probable HAF family extracellular repeat protein